jgi:hypothetical protein
LILRYLYSGSDFEFAVLVLTLVNTTEVGSWHSIIIAGNLL